MFAQQQLTGTVQVLHVYKNCFIRFPDCPATEFLVMDLLGSFVGFYSEHRHLYDIGNSKPWLSSSVLWKSNH